MVGPPFSFCYIVGVTFPQVIYLDSYFCFVFALFFILLEYTLMSAEDVIYYELTQEDKVEEYH